MLNKIILLSAIALASFSLTPFRQLKQVNHVKQKVSQSQQKLSLDEECDSLIVSLKQSASEVNKKCNNLISLFGESKIKDLTRIDDDVKEHFLNKNYTQMFKISLEPNQRNSIDSIIERVKKIPEVEYVKKNSSLPVCSIANDLFYTNDTQRALNGTYGVNISPVWSLTKGSSNIKVAVIDTGIASHPELKDNFLGGYDFFNDRALQGTPLDNHGTAIAGIIGAKGNNYIGIAGINWDISLLDMRCARGLYSVSEDSALEAFNMLTNLYYTNGRVPIINYCTQGFGYHTFIRNAISNFPGLVVWAAGNQNTNVDDFANIYGSFNLSNLISVGSIESNGNISASSNYSANGQNISIYAPGKEIISTDLNNTYCIVDGTSIAAPHVTGIAALLLSLDPSLSASDLKSLIVNGGTTQTSTKTNVNVKRLNAHVTFEQYFKWKYGFSGG